jgi:hypothetical protein
MVAAELRRRDDQLMIVPICAARKVRAAVHSGHAASWATALLLKVKNPKAPAIKRGRRRLGALMRGPISEAVIIVILGFLIGGIPAAVIPFMIDSKWPSPAVSLSRDPGASKAPLTSQ